jgi:hypothetical protein
VNNRKWGSGVGSKGGLRGAAAVARSDARSSKLPAPRVPPPAEDANNKYVVIGHSGACTPTCSCTCHVHKGGKPIFQAFT